MSFLKLRKHRRFIVIFLTSLLVFTFINDGHAASIDIFEYKDAYSSHPSQPSQIDIFKVSIPQLGGRQRNIQVYLPPGYDSSEKAYPVFYLYDGANLFNPLPEAVGDYAVDETLDRLFDEGSIGGIIVVGIEHDDNYPWGEYMPWVNENMHDWIVKGNSDPVEGGEGFAFLDFIVETLKPEIDSRYRTLDDRENTAIGGFCRMGIIPILAGIEYPDVFSGVMAMSPAVWMAEGGGQWLSNNQLIRYINNHQLPENVKFYIDIGTEEVSGNRPPVKDQNGKRITYPQAYVEGAQALTNALLNNGVPESNVYFRVIDGVKGTRDIWAQRLDEVVLWLFGEENVEVQSAPTEPTIASSATESPTTEIELPMEEDQLASETPADNEENEDPVEAEELNITFAIILGSALVFCFIAAIYLIFRRR